MTFKFAVSVPGCDKTNCKDFTSTSQHLDAFQPQRLQKRMDHLKDKGSNVTSLLAVQD